MTDCRRNKVHAYIIESREPAQREKTSLKLAQAFVCDVGGDEPCGVCRQCRMALAGVHPDIIFIDRLKDDKGKLRREIYVDQIRDMSADAWVRPQQAESKVYIVREANLMNQAAQNAALKILEEPPVYAVFILCTDSADELLPTVRSRCVTVRAQAKDDIAENDSAEQLLAAAASNDIVELTRLCWKFDALDTEATVQVIEACRGYLGEAVCGSRDVGLSRREARRLQDVFDTAAEYLKINVSAKHVWGYISVSAILK